MEQNKQIGHLLSKPQEIVITSHRNPDGDALGSSIGLSFYLKKLLHNVKVIMPSDYPYNFEWMPDIQEVVIYDQHREEAKRLIEGADIIFCLDYNSLDRVDKMGVFIQNSNADKIMIDHHMDPEPFVDFMISDTSASSTSEMVFEFIVDQGHEDKLDKVIANCLYAGILTDTGSFRHNTSVRLYEIVATLKKLDMDNLLVHDHIYNNMAEKHIRLIGHCLNNRMEILEEFDTGIIYLTKEDYKNFDIQRGDTEGIVNYLMMLRNVRLAAFITEQPTIVKLSLRSKGDLSVQKLAKEQFNGGGHKNASGGYSHQSLKATIDKFKSALPHYVNAPPIMNS